MLNEWDLLVLYIYTYIFNVLNFNILCVCAFLLAQVNNNHNCNNPKEGPASPTLERVPSYRVYASRSQSPSGDIDHDDEEEATGCCSQGRALCVDTVSRVAFPMGFVIFNFAYWTYYLTS